jgi:hypothetical protein
MCLVAALPTSDTTVASPQSASTGTYLHWLLALAQIQISSPVEDISQQLSPATSPNVPPRAMPIPQGPRRAAPPRKKVTPKPTLVETEVAPESLGEDPSGVTPEDLPSPIPVPSYVETEVVAVDPIADVSPSEPASGGPTEESLSGPAPIVRTAEEMLDASPPSAQLPSDAPDLRPESPKDYQAHSTTVHDLLHAADPIELDVHSELRDLRNELVFEEATHEPSKGGVSITEEEDEDETVNTQDQYIPARVSEAGGLGPSGGQTVPSPPSDETTTLHDERKLSVDTYPEETGDSTLESQPLHIGAPLISHSVYQQGGSANVVDDEDGGDNGKY